MPQESVKKQKKSTKIIPTYVTTLVFFLIFKIIIMYYNELIELYSN